MSKTIEPRSVVSKNKIQEFVTLRKKLKTRGQSAIGELGVETNSFVEKNSLNKTGVSIFNRLNEMPAEKRADVRRTLDALIKHYETEWGKQEELAFEGSTEDDKKAA